MDDPRLDDYNVDQKVNDFLNSINDQSQRYKTSNLILTLGSDFQYSNAHMWYKNLDKLIFYVNQRQQNGSKVNIFYSTTACYLYSLNRANTTWTVKYDDFFPYAHRPHSFWTGYFTSRAALKNYVRRANNYMQAVRQLAVLAQLNSTVTSPALDTLERAMGVAQHHDAVSGTERQHVANDYAKRLSKGMASTLSIIQQAYQQILDKKLHSPSQAISNVLYCSLLNITECLPIEGQSSFTIVVYNPLPRPVSAWIRVPTVTTSYSVTDMSQAQTLTVDFAPVYDEVKQLPERKSKANYNMVFQASLDALGFKVYSVSRQSNDAEEEEEEVKKEKSSNMVTKLGDTISIHNQYLQLTFGTNGNLMEIENLDTYIKTRLNQQFCIYQSMKGNNSDSQFQASGAYIFRPQSSSPTCLGVKNFTIYNGEQFVELHQTYNEWIHQTVRLYQYARNVEFEWQVGPIDISDNEGREVVSVFSTDLASNKTFYTDANGREMLKRVRDFRPSWPNFVQTENVSGNYYPINSRIYIRDETTSANARQLTILTDRSQGGASISDGEVEIMVHRRVLNDDSLGVSEPLNDTGSDQRGLRVRGQFSMVFNTTAFSARLHRDLAHQINTQPLVTFTTTSKKALNKQAKQSLKALANWNALSVSLPENIHLLTLDRDSYDDDDKTQNSFILRLEHFYELNEDAELSQQVTVNLQTVFAKSFNLIGVEELGLGANIKVADLNQRLKWQASDDESAKYQSYLNEMKKVKSAPLESNDGEANSMFDFTFNPMQIRTFRVWYLPN